MKHILLLLLFFSSSLFANTVVTENDPSTLVHGVSVITGDLYTFDEDLVVAGAHPIRIHRGYLSKSGDWKPDAHFFATRTDNSSFEIREPNGTKLYYLKPSVKHKKGKEIKAEPIRCITLIERAKGLSNTASGVISARTNYQNQYLVVEKDPDWLTLFTASGIKRRYKVLHEENQPKRKTPIDQQKTIYSLHVEEFPDGHILEYKWDKYKIHAITSKSPRNIPYAKVTFREKKKNSTQKCKIVGSDQKVVKYKYDVHMSTNNAHLMLHEIKPADGPKRYFTYSEKRKHEEPPHLKKISLHYDRAVAIDYEPYDYSTPRVKRLLAPLGTGEEMLASHTFSYFPNEKHSYVVDAKGNKTDYFWDADQHIIRIDTYEGFDRIHSSEQFVWEGPNLRSKSLFDKDHALISLREYTYDSKGNVIEEAYSGKLSNGKSITKTTYTDYHLPLRQEEPSGLVTLYEYLPNTHLLKTKILCDHDQAKIYYHYEYNNDLLLIREIVEDGLTKTIRNIHPRLCDLYFGMPGVIEEKYEQDGREILLSKTMLDYGNGGRVEHKAIYDANNVHRYNLHYSYDEKGRLQRETNAYGWESLSRYDAVGNHVYTKDFGGVETRYDYDLSNRLIKKEIIGWDGLKSRFHYHYDHTHQLTAEIDAKDHATQYTLTPLGKRAANHLPPIATENGTLNSPVTQSFYDSAGNEVTSIDAEGFATHTTYNVYGKPIHRRHPNGAEESWTYTVDGTLQSHTDPTGVLTTYTTDYLKRITRKTISSHGTILAEESFQYQGLHLISKTDAEGHVTSYTYDRAGRKIAETYANETTLFYYDEFSRNHRTEQGTLRTIHQFDLLGRIEETREEDIPTGALLRKVITHYDRAGNKTALSHWIQEDNIETSERFEYDSLNRLLTRTDPSGHRETFSYNDHYINSYNQRVLQKTHTDPMGLQTIETFDTHNRIVKTEKIHHTRKLSIEEKFYNPRGKLSLQNNTAFASDGSQRTIRTRWEYDVMGRLTKLIEAEGTLDAKITTHTYTPRGEKQTTTKPDGTLLSFTYNPLSHLERLDSSDGTIHHHMRYNKLGQLTWHDGIERTVDARGSLLEEKFPHYTIQNRYNSMGKRIECSCPEADFRIEYSYRGSDMTHIIRKTYTGQELYTHQYLAHDLSGNLLSSLLPNNMGQIRYRYDRNARRESIEAPNFIQKALAIDKMGNILHLLTQDNHSHFSYDELYQLTSESGVFNHTYRYDSLYCRLSKDQEPYQTNALNQVTSHILYDKNGNPLRYKDTQYTWDALDRLIQIQTPQYSQTFIYDSQHRRLSATTQSTTEKTEYFLYDGQNEIGSLDANLQVQSLRILGATPHAEIGAAIGIEIGKQIYAPIHDLSGNLAALLPLNGGECEQTYFSAFGEDMGSHLSPWRFSSKRVDENSALVYYGRRYYQPDLGRWLSPDPAGFTDGMNLYAFVHNDPLTHFDEYGLFSMLISAPSLSLEMDQFRKNASYYPPILNTAAGIYKSPRFQGSMQAFAGFTEASFGAGMTYATGGLAAPAGWAVMAHGLDHFFTGMKTAITGRSNVTLTSQLLQKTGVPAQAAGFIDNSLSIGGSTIAAAAIRYTQSAIFYNFRLPPAPSIANTGMNNALRVGNFRYANTAGNHINDIIKKGTFKGELSRPYMKSPLTVNEIMAAGKPIPDPGGIPGGLRWDIPGTFRGSEGTWELVIHPKTEMIYHFNFLSR